MYLISNKNMPNTIRVLILVMLFQLLSPAVFALVSEPKKAGHFSTLCTLQGYKQIWVGSNDEQKESDSATLSCPYCLFNLSALDAISTQSIDSLNAPESYFYHVLISQDGTQTKSLLTFLLIRAPPYFS